MPIHNRKKYLFVVSVVAVLGVSLPTVKFWFDRINDIYSIGIINGHGLFSIENTFQDSNPVITADDINDVPAGFVADPFMIRSHNAWYMFFEVLNNHSAHGDIGLAVSKEGKKWKYMKIVLDEDFHLAYPYVFEWQGSFYMIPDTSTRGELRLYKAQNFPVEWKLEKVLLKGTFIDPTVIYYDNIWWLFAESNLNENDRLKLYYSDALEGNWVEHSLSPVINGNPHISRPGGRMIKTAEGLYRVAQDDFPRYGMGINIFKIIRLSKNEYQEVPYENNPLLYATGEGWNKDGIHTFDLHFVNEHDEWIACVDGVQATILSDVKYTMKKIKDSLL